MSEELLYDYDDEMLQIDLDYFNQFDHLFNDSSGTDSFRFAKPSLDNLQNGQLLINGAQNGFCWESI